MTDHIGKWLRVSGILGEIEVTAFVTSQEWGQIAEELKEPRYEGTVVPTPANFAKLRVAHNLLLCNSGCEDQETVNILNNRLLGEENARLFAWRRDNLISGKLDHFTTDRKQVYDVDLDYGAEILKTAT
jgi:hypothetical protein